MQTTRKQSTNSINITINNTNTTMMVMRSPEVTMVFVIIQGFITLLRG